MSKEELLKYLIAEIDLIMHDKDYRFENANGTWYSRESCRDLTNEEVFEELRSELRQFADLEAKLTEKDAERELDNSFWKQECDSLQKTLVEKDKEIEKWSTQYARAYVNRQNDLIAKNNQLKQQLEGKEKEQNQKAIKELEKLKETLIHLRNLEIEAIRETNEYEFNSLEARKYWVANHKESLKTYNNMIKKIYNQINGLKEKK